MKRLALLLSLVASLTLCVVAPVSAVESQSNIVSIVPGFQQNLVDIVGVTYDRETRTTRVTVTVHCFHGYYQVDADTVIDLGESELQSEQIGSAVQGGRSRAITGVEITELNSCDTRIVFSFAGLNVGNATFTTSISQGLFSGSVTTTTTIRAVLLPR